jgi:GNAT superfamily N-acetyltransferase
MEHFLITLREYNDSGFVGHVQIGTDIKYPNDKRVYIHDLYVIKAFRQKGYGTRLMYKVLDTCKKLDIPQVYLWCIPKRIPFYKEFGAEDTHQIIDGYYLMMINIK